MSHNGASYDPSAPKDQISFCLYPPSWYRIRSIQTITSCRNTCSLEPRRFANICCITTCLSFLEARFGAYRSSTSGNMVHVCPFDEVQAEVDASAGEKYCSTHDWVLLGGPGIRLKGIWMPYFFSDSGASQGSAWEHHWDTTILRGRSILAGEILMRSPAMSSSYYACMVSGKGPHGVILGALWTVFGM